MVDLTSYSERRSWSDAHLEQVKSALGRKFLLISTFKQDAQQGIDLVVFHHEFAVRIRQLKYKNYLDFTLRTSGGGERSEYAKLLAVTAPDYVFYGYALDKNTLAAGYLIDIKQWKLSVAQGETKPIFRRNRDGSHFVAFSFKNKNNDLYDYVEQII